MTIVKSQTVDTPQILSLEALAHPQSQPDLAPSDYHLFNPLNKILRGSEFTSDQY